VTLALELKALVARGNVVDLAVAVVLGAAFTAIVNAIAAGLFVVALVVKRKPPAHLRTVVVGGRQAPWRTAVLARSGARREARARVEEEVTEESFRVGASSAELNARREKLLRASADGAREGRDV
jgi:hypothetical protein